MEITLFGKRGGHPVCTQKISSNAGKSSLKIVKQQGKLHGRVYMFEVGIGLTSLVDNNCAPGCWQSELLATYGKQGQCE